MHGLKNNNNKNNNMENKMQDSTKDFYIHLKSFIQDAKLNVNTQTQSLNPKIQSGLHLNVGSIGFEKESQNGIPPVVWTNIQKNTKCTLTYTIPTSDKLIKSRSINFVVAIQDACDNKKVGEINASIRLCLVWLSIAQKNAKRNKCNEDPLIIYLLFSPLTKSLTKSAATKANATVKNKPLNWTNANSAFTFVCDDGDKLTKKQKIRKIVIFRKEEWFKVFIHETFHNYGFDFANQTPKYIQRGTEFILNQLYPVKSDVNLYEAYTECWARLIAIGFLSDAATDASLENNDNKYLAKVQQSLDKEIAFSFFQAAKVLEYMDIQAYDSLTSGKAINDYREQTSILSYYILCLVLFSNYNEFISWIHKLNSVETNKTIKSTQLSEYIIFPQTNTALDSFCRFLKNHYKTTHFTNTLNQNIRTIQGAKQPNAAMMKTMRMTFQL